MGWVGLNPEKAKNNINHFFEEGEHAAVRLGTAFTYLSDQLKINWASPNAVSFGQATTPQVSGIMDDFCHLIYDICCSATNAYNAVAASQGETSIGFDRSVSTFAIEFDLSDNKNGNVGMEMRVIRDYVIPEFNKLIKDAITDIESLPTEIALYDDEDSQQHYFQTGIKAFGQRVTATVEDINGKITDECEREMGSTNLGVKKSEEELSGIGTHGSGGEGHSGGAGGGYTIRTGGGKKSSNGGYHIESGSGERTPDGGYHIKDGGGYSGGGNK